MISGILVLSAIAVGAASVGAMYQAFNRLQPSKGRINRDLAAMKVELGAKVEGLVPLQQKELELLSHNLQEAPRRQRKKAGSQGVFISIYSEPMVAWSYKDYSTKKVKSLVYARTARHEFTVLEGEEVAEFLVDNKPVGILQKNGQMVSAKNNKLLARLELGKANGMIPVYMNRREVAQIVPEGLSDSPNPRVFTLVSSMQPAERELLVAITVWVLIRQKLGLDKEPKALAKSQG